MLMNQSAEKLYRVVPYSFSSFRRTLRIAAAHKIAFTTIMTAVSLFAEMSATVALETEAILLIKP